MSVLKIEVHEDTFVLKHFDGNHNSFVVNFEFSMNREQAGEFLRELRHVLRRDCEEIHFSCDGYSVNARCNTDGSLSISVWEVEGERTRPAGAFTYNKYMGGAPLLVGIRNVSVQLSKVHA